jgi:hypothetical protein
VFFLLTLPFRILFGVLLAVLVLPLAVLAVPLALLAIPFLLLRFVIKAAALFFVLPVVAVAVMLALGLALFVALCAMLAPLLPFAAVAFIIWAIVHASRPVFAP